LIKETAESLPSASVIVVDDGDHSFKVPKRTGKAAFEVIAEIAKQTADWIIGTN
jgi:hypothetical protein